MQDHIFLVKEKKGENPRSGGGVDIASTDALASEFKPHSVYKYGFFTPMPSGSLELGAPLT